MSEPLLVVVTGPPGAGKTTIARALARELGLPLVSKDDVKETLFDALGSGDRAWSQRLGRATLALLFLHLRELLGAGVSAIVEANFTAGTAESELAALPSHRAVQLHCAAPADVLVERFAGRSNRHPGHVDDTILEELEPRIRSGEWRALDLPGTLIELDTTESIDPCALAKRIIPT